MIFYVILIYDPAERTANIHAVPANMLLNPSPHISIFQFFLFFMNSTLLTKQDQTVSLRPSAKTYLRKSFNFSRLILQSIVWQKMTRSLEKEMFISGVVDWTFPSEHTRNVRTIQFDIVTSGPHPQPTDLLSFFWETLREPFLEK